MATLKQLLSADAARILELERVVANVNKCTHMHTKDEDFPALTEKLRKQAQEGDLPLVEALALVREAAYRKLGMFAYDVQVMSAAAIAKGYVTEQATGEGKALVGVLVAYVLSLYGEGVHVITVNDYLAKRDSEEASTVLNFLGVSVGYNEANMSLSDKQEAFSKDVTYTTHSEVGFDYLRDNLAASARECVLTRGLAYAVIDEIDSVLIDEARTPLIIANSSGDDDMVQYKLAAHFVKTFSKDDYTFDATTKSVSLTNEGVDKAEAFYGISSLYDSGHIGLTHFIDNALKAEYGLFKDVDYDVREGQVELIDAFSGRVMEGRRYSDGLHQAIEAKEGVEIQEETTTSASVTYQNLFKMYKQASGMSGTVMTEKEEFFRIYNRHVVAIPTNRPRQRIDRTDRLFVTNAGKYQAIIEDVRERHAKGQPVLIGTVAVERSEAISEALSEAGIPHTVLNAKNHAKEAEIVKMAGQEGAVTVATNMAGRGTDIKLSEKARAAGGLYVIGTERHESRRIDNQLRGRSGRQGDVGESQFYISLEDDLLVRFGSEKLRNLYLKQGLDPMSEIPLSNMMKRQVETAQRRIEGSNYDARKQVLEYDDVIRKQRESFYAERLRLLTVDDSELREIVFDMMTDEIYAIVIGWEDDFFSLNQTLNVLVGDNAIFQKTDTKERIRERLERAFDVKYGAYTEDSVNRVLRNTCLVVLDRAWAKQLSILNELRQSVSWRGFAQVNPLVAYQLEAFQQYEDLVSDVRFDTTQLIMHP